ncbi:hypothetical protein EDM56_23595 [Brevibacillus fluminis]|uniref:Uncharacterized protein n=1 Tax=Brevibacillus fluminis TaxID=511487 RepID=A0A3M8D327_9BACL|nr:hypothetical protein [Brevibacillus fluminis]RNB82313.1 hypothetical protein EDM56_23595 [Brevibacillus fluminis]
MDFDKSLNELKGYANKGLLRDVEFTAEMQRAVQKRIASIPRAGTGIHFGWKWLGGAVCACLIGFGLLVPNTPNPLPPEASDGNLWQPAAEHTTPFEGKSFTYLGEKPVRVITGDMYEKQGQKVMFLLNGPLMANEKVQLVGENQQGERIDLGKYAIGSKLYDADGHFPTGLTLPTAGLWKIEVRYRNEVLGNVFLTIKAGVSPSNESLVLPLITQFLQATDDFAWIGDKRKVSLELLGVDSPNAEQRIVYAKVTIESEQTNGSAVAAPMKFNIVYRGGDYRVIDYQMPRDGSDYWLDIQTIFPSEIVEKLRASGHAKQG